MKPWSQALILVVAFASFTLLAAEDVPPSAEPPSAAPEPPSAAPEPPPQTLEPSPQTATPDAAPAHPPVSPPPTPDSSAPDAVAKDPAAVETEQAPAPEMPSIDQRRRVGFVATGAAVVALTTAVVAGVLAQAQYDCVSDVVRCNKQRDDEIIGAELFAARTDFQTKALYADMGFVSAAVAALVAVASFVAAVEEPAVGAP